MTFGIGRPVLLHMDVRMSRERRMRGAATTLATKGATFITRRLPEAAGYIHVLRRRP